MTDPPTGLLLISRGQAVCHVTGVVGGQRSCTGLTPPGSEQARQLAARLTRGEAVTVMYTGRYLAGSPVPPATVTSQLARTEPFTSP